jgi:hypothetical protein
MYRRIAYYLATSALLLGIASGAGVSATRWAAQGRPIAGMDSETEVVEYRVKLFTASEHGGSAPLAAEAGDSDKFGHVRGGSSAEAPDEKPVESISLN